MARIRLPGIVLIAALTLSPSAGRAATAWGTLITNVATITMMSGFPDFVGYSVSFNMTCTVLIVGGPCITAQKIVSPPATESGQALNYRIWIINCSPLISAFNITVNDRLPDNAMMWQDLGNWDGGSGGTFSKSNSANSITWSSGMPATGQGAPYYIRWVLNLLGPGRSAFVEFSAKVL